MNVIDKRKWPSLNESGQGQLEVKFAIINPQTGEAMTPFCKCKDYFSDLFWALKLGKSFKQYGFVWNTGEDNGVLTNADEFAVAIRIIDRSSKKLQDVTQNQLESILYLIGRIENINNFKSSRGIISDDNKDIIITFNKDWVEVPYVLSALFLLFRIGFTYTDGNIFEWIKTETKFMSPHDSMYLRNSKETLEDLENGIIDRTQTWSNYLSSYDVHNSSGVQSYSYVYKDNKQKKAKVTV